MPSPAQRQPLSARRTAPLQFARFKCKTLKSVALASPQRLGAREITFGTPLAGSLNMRWPWHGFWRRSSVTARWTAGSLILLLLVARLLLAFVVERYVNRQLNRAQDYGGRIGKVVIQLWRGRYRIDSVEIFKRSGGVQVPLFASDRIYLSIEWSELFHGALAGEARLEKPRLNFVSGPTAPQSQNGTGERWNDMLGSLFPFQLNRLEIDDGQIHFENKFSTPPVDVSITRCSVVATNLSNAREIKSSLPAGITAHGTSVGGTLAAQLQLDPMAAYPTFQATAQITNVDLAALNDFLKAYGKFDVASGRFALFASVASKDGNYDGYAKVLFEKLHVFAWEKERKKDALEVFWQAIVGTLTTAFKNQNHDLLATRIPISGSYGREKIGTLTAVGSLLRNAFIKAMSPRLDGEVTVAAIGEKEEEQRKMNRPGPPEKGAQGLTKPER
jgi:hypothetical protein